VDEQAEELDFVNRRLGKIEHLEKCVGLKVCLKETFFLKKFNYQNRMFR